LANYKIKTSSESGEKRNEKINGYTVANEVLPHNGVLADITTDVLDAVKTLWQIYYIVF
jgi:hypothetical protein